MVGFTNSTFTGLSGRIREDSGRSRRFYSSCRFQNWNWAFFIRGEIFDSRFTYCVHLIGEIDFLFWEFMGFMTGKNRDRCNPYYTALRECFPLISNECCRFSVHIKDGDDFQSIRSNWGKWNPRLCHHLSPKYRMSRPQNCTKCGFQDNLPGLRWTEMFVLLLVPCWEILRVWANNAPKSIAHLQSKIFCAATPELVLFHTEISRNPTNLFSRVVNSSCELKLLAYIRNIRMWTCLQGVLYFKTKIWMTTRLSCCFSMNSYATMFWIKKSTHWHTIRT